MSPQSIVTVLAVLFLLSAWTVESKKGPLCPSLLRKLLGDEKSCRKVKCASSLVPSDCDENLEYMDNVTECGCCPACVKRQKVKLGETCNEFKYEECPDKVCSVISSDCDDGLVCNAETKRCTQVDISKQLKCADKLALWESGQLHWKPSCKPDGTYAPRQCKGDKDSVTSMCFCSTPEGERIFGRRFWNDKTEEEMNCACSIHAHELGEKKSLISTLHCTYDGSYEQLQCDTDSSLCYCVNGTTGALTGAVLPENQWTHLPCYNKTLMGDKYLRQCDSYWAATERINREASLHGLNLSLYKKYRCDYDGSFAKYQNDGGMEYCAHRDGRQIESYTRRPGSGSEKMTCNCARDPDDSAYEGLPNRQIFTCEGDLVGIGNYQKVQILGNQAICVDSDGFSYGNEVSPAHSCCLDGTCNPQEQLNCYDPQDNPTGARNCDDYIV